MTKRTAFFDIHVEAGAKMVPFAGYEMPVVYTTIGEEHLAVRNAAGLDNYTGGTSPAELVAEILYNRRYSLFAEGGHRWIDARRFGILNTLPIDRAGDGTFEQFPIPLTENQ